jgi:hypothetical protein
MEAEGGDARPLEGQFAKAVAIRLRSFPFGKEAPAPTADLGNWATARAR